MRSAVLILMTMALMLCGCDTAPPQRPVPQDSPASEILRAYQAAVWNELLPRIDELSVDEIQREVTRLAAKHVGKQRNLLVAEAEYYLEQLPTRSAPNPSQWEPVIPNGGASDKIVEMLHDSLRAGTDQCGLLSMHMWNPLAVASFCRSLIQAKVLEREVHSKRAMLAAMVSPRLLAVRSDPARPLLAYEMGPELMLIGLRRGEDGNYTVHSCQWLRRREPASQPATRPTIR